MEPRLNLVPADDEPPNATAFHEVLRRSAESGVLRPGFGGPVVEPPSCDDGGAVAWPRSDA